MSALRWNQSGCSTSAYQSMRSHMRDNTPPMLSCWSHFFAKSSCGTRVPASTRATCERSHGILRARPSCVSPAASRKCFKTSPNTAAVVAAAPPGAFRRFTLPPPRFVTVVQWHAISIAPGHSSGQRFTYAQ